MPPRVLARLVVVYLALGALIALVAFIKIMLSPLLAVFVAGLGIGALGVLGVLIAAGKSRRPA